MNLHFYFFLNFFFDLLANANLVHAVHDLLLTGEDYYFWFLIYIHVRVGWIAVE